MGIDRISDDPDANAETVEEKPDRRPPPPPDKPGTDGYPSRADSRLGAAAASETSTQTTDRTQEWKPEPPSPPREESREQVSTATEDKLEASATSEVSEGESSEDRNRKDERSAPLNAADHRQDGSTGASSSVENAEPTSAGSSPGPSSTGIVDGAQRRPEDAVPESENPKAPGESVDAQRDGAAEECEDAEPAADASGAAALRGDHRQVVDERQPDSSDEALPAADVSPVGDHDSSGLEEEAGKAAKEPGTTLAERTETPGQRLERPDDETAPGDDGKVEGTDPAGTRPLGERLMVDGKPIRDHIDPLGAVDVDTDLVTKPWTDPTDGLPPTGKELADMESDKLSRFERLRREGYRKIDDGLDVTEKGFDLGVGAFARPPTHAETRTAQPEFVDAPHQGVTAGEAATGLLAAGIMIGELLRWGHGKLTEEKERS
jgi:hypothetical protein